MFTHPKKFLHLMGSPIYIALKDDALDYIPQSGYCTTEYVKNLIDKSLQESLIPIKENPDGSISPMVSSRQKKYAHMLCCVDYSEVQE